MKDDYTTNSHYLTYTFWENILFERVKSFTPKSAYNFKFPLQPHQKYSITQYEELDFSQLTQMKDDYTTNSCFLTYTFWENILFERVKPFTPKSAYNFKFSLQPHQKYSITQYEELDFSQLTQMKDDYTTNSHL